MRFIATGKGVLPSSITTARRGLCSHLKKSNRGLLSDAGLGEFVQLALATRVAEPIVAAVANSQCPHLVLDINERSARVTSTRSNGGNHRWHELNTAALQGSTEEPRLVLSMPGCERID